jgi:hypothetical protein
MLSMRHQEKSFYLCQLAVDKSRVATNGRKDQSINSMVSGYDKYYYPIALLHKGNQAKRIVTEKQQIENYQVSESNQRLPRI